jgi:hypothetical protein
MEEERETAYAVSAGEGTLISYGLLDDDTIGNIEEETGGENLTIILSNSEDMLETGK